MQSQRVAQKLGSRKLGPGRLPPPFEDARVDLWGQTRDEWRAQPFNRRVTRIVPSPYHPSSSRPSMASRTAGREVRASSNAMRTRYSPAFSVSGT